MLFRSWDGPVDQGWPAVSTVRVGAVAHLLVTGHALIRQVFADPETFRPDNALDAVTPLPVSALRVLARHGFRLPPTLANNSTPSHPGIRAVLAEALRPDRVEALRPWLTGVVRRRVGRLAAAVRAGGPADLYAELAADLPLLVLARLIALPADGVAVIKEFSRAALELFWGPVDERRQLELAGAVGSYHAVLRDFARTAPGMVARLREHAERYRLGSDVVVGALFFLLVAGQETTSQLLSLLLHRLVGHPAVLGDVISGRLRPADVVEEGLRLDPPITTWRRIVCRDTQLGGVAVSAGTPVLLWLARAGRDPAVVTAGDQFHPGQRGSRRHLAFGAGAHRCVGDQLARMEASVVVAETAPLLRAVVVDRAPWFPANLSFRIPDALVVRRELVRSPRR